MQNHTRQKLIELKGEKNKTTIILGYFNTPFTIIDGPTAEKHQDTKRTQQYLQPRGSKIFIEHSNHQQ